MTTNIAHTHFPGRLIFIAFGSIGQGVLPLILLNLRQGEPSYLSVKAG